MTTEQTPAPAPKIRLYLDEGKTNPAIDTKELKRYVLAMFIHWVNSHRHERDFIEAMTHVSTGLYTDYLMLGAPDLTAPDTEIPAYVKPPVAAQPTEQLEQPRLRFFDAEGDLTLGIEREPYRQVLTPFMVRWMAANYHQRDFIQCVSDVASCVYHDYDISCSLGGLGGCKRPDEFLSQTPVL